MEYDGPIAIVTRELPTLGPRVAYVSRDLVAVQLEAKASGYQITLAGLVERSCGLAWYVIKRSELIETPDAAVSTYNTAASWAERISHAAVERLALAAPEELL